MAKSRILKLSTLVKFGACPQQRILFKAKFGDSARVTPALCRRVAGLFSWDWGVNNLLSAQARTAYKAATAQAWTAYEAATAPAFAHAYINDTVRS